MTTTPDHTQLLQRHNPILVLYPQDTSRRRPGAARPGDLGWGDYHPCSAEFFLARVQQRDQPKSYDLRGLFRRSASWEKPARTGLAAVRAMLAAVEPEASRGWEFDVADIPSQKERQAWSAYAGLLREPDDPYELVVYARAFQGRAGLALQYWYLYLYNDFKNNHEGDWEMVTIELAADGSPQHIGVSCHHGGWQRPWSGARKEGDRPLVYVARGSHGGYLSYRAGGHHVVNVVRRLNLPRAVRFLGPLLQRLPFLRWRDHPPADPVLDVGAPAHDRGQRVEPTLKVVPEGTPAGDSDYWWMRYEGKWGSSHSRLFGTVGVDSPWSDGGRDPRWADPIEWLHKLRPARS